MTEKLRPQTLAMIDAAYEILNEIQPASVRAVCYRLFTMELIENMGKSQTNRVSRALVFAREQGIIPWDWIVDETRSPERPGTWSGPEHYARAVKRSYRRDRWLTQGKHVEVWSEKGTVRGTLAPVLEEFGVTFRVFHGYVSATTIKEIADESFSDENLDRRFLAFYVGDWDPSGLHMSQADLPDRLDRYGADVELRRIALVPEDLTDDLPSFDVATKTADPRWRYFLVQTSRDRLVDSEEEVRKCWELDAMSPVTLRDRMRATIAAEIDEDEWEAEGVKEDAENAALEGILDGWVEGVT